jgi:hypothetical protein
MRHLEKHPNLTQPELREHFEKLGVNVSSSESSMAFKKMGLTATRPPRKPRAPVLSIPLHESPMLHMKMEELRKQNGRLRRVIETLIDEEVDSALFATEN